MPRRFSVAIILVTLLLLVAVISLPFFPAGTRLLLGWVNGVGGLELQYDGGSLAGELSMKRILVSTEDAVVELRDVRTGLVLSCLWRTEICLSRLSANSLVVAVSDGDAADQDDEPSAFWPLPVLVTAREIVLASLRVHWDGGELRSSDLSGSAAVKGERVTVTRLAASGTLLSSPPAEVPGEPDAPLDLPDVDLPLEVLVEAAQLRDSAWSINGIENHYDQLELRGRWSGDRLEIEQATVAQREWGEARVSGDIIFLHPYTFGLDVSFTAHRPPLWSALEGASGDLMVRGSLASMALAGQVCGRLPLTLEGTIDLVDAAWPLALQARGGCDRAAGPIDLAGLPALAGAPALTLAGDWTVSVAGDWHSQQIDTAATATGYDYGPVAIGINAVHRAGSVQLQQLVAESPPGRRTLQAGGEIAYGERLAWDLALQLDALALPDQLQPLAGELSGSLRSAGQVSGDSWQLELSQMAVQGTVAELPASLAGTLRLNQDLDLAGSTMELGVNGSRLLVHQPQPGLPRADVTLRDLGRWLEGAGGDLQAVLAWNREEGEVTVTGASDGVYWGELQLAGLELRGRGRFEAREPLAFSLHAGAVQLGEASPSELTLELQGTAAKHRLTLALNGDLTTALTLDGALAEGDWRGQLQPMTISSPYASATLASTVAVDYLENVGQLGIAAHCWQGAEGGDLCLEPSRWGASGEARLRLHGDLQSVAAYLPERFHIRGPLNAQIDARWRALELEQMSAHLDVAGGEIEEALLGGERAEFAWEKLTLAYRGNRNTGRLQGVLRHRGVDQLAMDLTLPTDLDRAVSGGIALQRLELAVLQPFLPSLSTLSGELVGDLRVAGDIRQPRLRGAIKLAQGRVSPAGIATIAEDIQLRALFDGLRADLEGQLSLGGGSSRVQGSLEWSGEPKLSLAMSGDEKELRFPSDTRVFVTEDLRLDISTEQIALTGVVDIPRGQLRLEQMPQGAVEVSEDVELYDGRGRTLARDAAKPVAIDLQVRIADRFEVVADGLAGRVGGELEVVRRPGRPLAIFGNIKVPEGRFEMLGPRFDVTRGDVSFVGIADNPQLDIALERQISEDQVTVGIRVGGNLSQPRLDFYSRPALPEEEVMAYVLGGRGIDRTGDADSLAIALAMTSGLMQSSGILKGISLGVEGKDRRARAAIGGYISDRIYLSYGVGLYSPVNTLTVRMDILHNLWMEVVSGIQSSADLYYVWSRR